MTLCFRLSPKSELTFKAVRFLNMIVLLTNLVTRKNNNSSKDNWDYMSMLHADIFHDLINGNFQTERTSDTFD